MKDITKELEKMKFQFLIGSLESNWYFDSRCYLYWFQFLIGSLESRMFVERKIYNNLRFNSL